MSKATIVFGALLTALLASSAPACAKGHSDGGVGKAGKHQSASQSMNTKKKHPQHASKPPVKSDGGAGAGKPPGNANIGGAGAGRPPGDNGNIGGAGAGRPPGDTGNIGGAGAGKPPGYTSNPAGAGAGRPPGDTGHTGGAGASKS